MWQKWVVRTGEQQGSSRRDRRAASKPFPCSGTAQQPKKGAQASNPPSSTLGPSRRLLLSSLQTPCRRSGSKRSDNKRSNVRLPVPKKVSGRESQTDPGRRHSPQTLRSSCLARPSKSPHPEAAPPKETLQSDNKEDEIRDRRVSRQ